MNMTNRTLVVGDLHCKMTLVLPRVADAAVAQCCDSIVLLGDLCDDWRVSGPVMVRQLEFAAEWKKRMEDLGLSVTVLLGNHDSSYRGMYQYEFTRLRVLREVDQLLRRGWMRAWPPTCRVCCSPTRA